MFQRIILLVYSYLLTVIHHSNQEFKQNFIICVICLLTFDSCPVTPPNGVEALKATMYKT